MNIPIIHFNAVADGVPPSVLFGNEEMMPSINFEDLRAAQQGWAATPIKDRVQSLRRFRHAFADSFASLLRAMKPRDQAHVAEILSSQIIPLADACRFLERDAARLLRPKKLGRRGRPVWLSAAHAEVHREPCGVVLVIAPSNYPLLLPGVITLQALAAGNAVVIKPGLGGTAIAEEFLKLLHHSGIDPALTLLLGESQNCVSSAIRAGVNKVVFTGSANAGRKILAQCALPLVPAVMELSGCDAMFVRADADVSLAVRALIFGLRLNRGATCIAPRRVFVYESRAAEFEAECVRILTHGERWTIPGTNSLAALVVEASAQGARVIAGEVDHHGSVTLPLLVADAKPSMRLMREDHFASVAAIMTVRDDDEALACNGRCPYALGASIFSGNESEARVLASRINVGSVVINDVIVPTADPRLPFGGRQDSGFGVTRGAEGLLELTTPKVVVTRRGKWRPHFDALRAGAAEFFTQFLSLTHGSSWSKRGKAALNLIRAARARRQS